MFITTTTGATAMRGQRRCHRAIPRRGFTLMESLMAAGVLLGIVVAVTTAVTAGQQNAYEAQRRIAGALAAEELMGRIAVEPYNRLASWHGHVEDPGELIGPGAAPLPQCMQSVGREVSVISELRSLSGLDVRVRGMTVTVRTVTPEGRVLVSLTRFVPEPQA